MPICTRITQATLNAYRRDKAIRCTPLPMGSHICMTCLLATGAHEPHNPGARRCEALQRPRLHQRWLWRQPAGDDGCALGGHWACAMLPLQQCSEREHVLERVGGRMRVSANVAKAQRRDRSPQLDRRVRGHAHYLCICMHIKCKVHLSWFGMYGNQGVTLRGKQGVTLSPPLLAPMPVFVCAGFDAVQSAVCCKRS